MNENFSLKLRQLWLLVSITSLVLPVFIPSSSVGPEHFLRDVIGAITVTMFILSFPCSFFGLPVLAFVKFALSVNENSIEGMYLNLFLLFAMGLVQWFWIFPRLAENEPKFQALNLGKGKLHAQFSEAFRENDVQFRRCANQTPLERVFQEEEGGK